MPYRTCPVSHTTFPTELSGFALLFSQLHHLGTLGFGLSRYVVRLVAGEMDQDLCSDGVCRNTQAGKLTWLDRGRSGSVKDEDSVNGKMEKTAETVE
ncbi:hypothetical protein PG996_012915 [Apiospora saccharicola]|uniref:Uncharacterized protein n=1 Tax=Apiospora saccharicola TaxID=335842 RepID=A0ABR1U6S6_9PEZI